MRLRDCLPSLRRDVIDLMITYDRRPYKGEKASVTMVMRLVGNRIGESGEYHLYFTDLSPEEFNAEQIAELYHGRWCIELLFKELKSRDALDVIKTEKPEIVKALICSAMITLVFSRRLFVGYRDAMARAGEVVTTDRWSRFFFEYAGVLLRRLLAASENEYSEKVLNSMALRETFSPNPLQENLGAAWDV